MKKIPKKIHFVWLGGNEYPPLVKKCMESWFKYLDDYEFVLWNESNSPMHIPYVKRAMEMKQYAFAADYIRLYALYEEGGIYLDTDMEILKDLDPLCESSFFLGRESNEWISAGIIGSEKNFPLLKKMLTAIESMEDFDTLPKIITPIINEFEFAEEDSVVVYPPEYFYPYPYKHFLMAMDITDKTFAIHHWAKSWDVDTGAKKASHEGSGICVKLKQLLSFFRDDS